jgi:hypothetical protein
LIGAGAAALALLLAFGRASAETGTVPPAPAPSQPAAQKTAASSAADAVADGEKRLRNMTARVSRIKQIRDHAAAARDATQLSCVQYQEAKARVVLQLAQDTQQAQTSANDDAAERAYQGSRLTMLDDMLQGVQKAANLCVDQELSTVQSYKVEVNVSEGIPSLEPTAPPPTLTAERPPER